MHHASGTMRLRKAGTRRTVLSVASDHWQGVGMGCLALLRNARLFEILVVGVNTPEVDCFAVKRISDGRNSRQHGVILVVVAMQSIAPDRLQVRKLRQVILDLA